MLSKNDMLIHCKDINESDFIIIKPKKHSQGQFVATVILMNIICFAFLFEYGFVPFIIGAILTLIGSVSSSTEFFRLVFYRDEIKFIFRNKERFFYWDELQTIRYERYLKDWKMNDVLYFSKKKTKKPRWLQPGLLFTPVNNSFYVELVDKKIYEKDTIHHSYPKYEFLDKLHEWGINIEIDEKYLIDDPILRKYVSNGDTYIEDNNIVTDNPNEWLINNHVICVSEYNDNYHISIDSKTIKNIGIKKVRRWGLEETIILNNQKYLLIYDNRRFEIVKNGRYLTDNKIYLPRWAEWLVATIGIGLILTCLFIRIFNLFGEYIDIVIIILLFITIVITGLFKLMKRR